MKLITVVGARPQFIKAAALSRALQSFSNIEEKIIHTGQHFDENMSQVFFDEMSIPNPSYNLDIHGMGHGAMTGQMLSGIEEILLLENPQAVLVYGDTNSTLAGALAARKLHIPVCHVEAGLRSFNMDMPEEINRILTDRISNVLYCPTTDAVKNLRNEGFDHFDSEIVEVGDVMQDAAKFYSELSAERSKILNSLPTQFTLVTLHRAENTDNPKRLSEIFSSLDVLHERLPIVMPIHPRTRAKMNEFGIQTTIQTIEPVGYFDMIEMLKACELVMTDSGGLQKEAFFFKKHCVTLRDQTEWVELVQGGFNKIVGADSTKIINAFEEFESISSNFEVDLYGNGNASVNVAKDLITRFG